MSLFVTCDFNGATKYLSLDGISASQWYANELAAAPTLSLSRADSGGFIKPSLGDMRLFNNFFDAATTRLPQITYQLKWADTDDDTAATMIYQGAALLGERNKNATTYKLWQPVYDNDLLDPGTDENGNDIDIPLAFGTIVHCSPQRTGTTSEYRYYYSNITPAGMTVYDDGVDITSNVSNNGDGTWSLSSTPVGEVSVCGTGAQVTLVDIFGFVASRLGKTASTTMAGSVDIDCWIDGQIKTIDFIDQLTGYSNHLCWLSPDQATFYLADRDSSAGTAHTQTSFDFFTAPVVEANPFKSIKAKWNVRQPVTDSTGHHLKDEERNAEAAGPQALGQEIEVTPYNFEESRVQTRLDTLSQSWRKPWGSITMPLSLPLPVYMDKYTVTDEQLPTPVTITLTVMGMEFDFAAQKIVLKGPAA